MSLEDTEDIVKKKLMDILVEELSVLKLDKIKKRSRSVHENDNQSNNGEDADTMSFSSSDTTAKLLKEVDSSENEAEYKMNKALNENAYEEMVRQIKYQHRDATIIFESRSVHENDNQSNNSEDADTMSFSSSDTTAKLLKEVDSSENESKYKINKALNENPYEEMERQIKYQHRDAKIINLKVNSEDEKATEISESKMCDNQHNKIGMNSAENFIPPPDDLAEKIRKRVEFYFEDYNLFKNSYLLNHILRNKKGYISLKVVCSLRKIKPLTRDFRVLTYCLRNSKVVELNPEKNKIRRIEPIPKAEDTGFGKTLMVFNLPLQNLSTESFKDMFKKFGKVVSADIFEIGSPESDIYHKRCLHFHRQIASKIYGIIKFENYDEVVMTLKDEEGHLPKENEVIAVPLLPQIYNKEKKHLKFLKSYPNPKRGYEKYKPKHYFYHYKEKDEVITGGGDNIRNETINKRGRYAYKRGYFRRPYRGMKPFSPSNMKNFAEDYVPREWNQSFRGMPKKWGENRQLRSNNSLNIDRLYSNAYRRKAGNGYISRDVSS